MIQNPIIIIGAPRSGTSILYRSLSLHSRLWHLPRESHSILEGPFHPSRWGYQSNRVVAADVDEAVTSEIHAGFEKRVMNLSVLGADQAKWLTDRTLLRRIRNRIALRRFVRLSQARRPESVRILEKTPRNSLRVSAMARIFPDARFVMLRREERANIDSLIAGWRAVDQIGPFRRQRFCRAGYPIADELQLQDYTSRWWKFALVPQWRKLRGRTVADVAAAQYAACNRLAEADLSTIASDRVYRLTHEQFVDDPVTAVREILGWAELETEPEIEAFTGNLPRVNDATPGLCRAKNGLRYPDEVDSAISRRAA